MEDKQLEKLEKVIQLIDTDYVTAEDFAESLVVLIQQLKNLDEEGEERTEKLATNFDKKIAQIEAFIAKQGEVSTKDKKQLSEAILRVREDIKDAVSDLKERIYSIKLRKGEKGDKGDKGDSIKGKDGSPDTPDQVIDKVNASKKKIDRERINLEDYDKKFNDIKRIAESAASLPVTTSFFNGIRAKNLTIEGGTASQIGDTVHISGLGGGGLTLQTNGTPNGSQTLLNLVAGSNITLTDNGTGSVTIAATGGSQDLQSVTDVGSTTTNVITVGGIIANSSVAGGYNIGLINGASGNPTYITVGGDQTNFTFIDEYANTLFAVVGGERTYNSPVQTIYTNADGASSTLTIPNTSGTIVISVNGTAPDAAGNVSIASSPFTIEGGQSIFSSALNDTGVGSETVTDSFFVLSGAGYDAANANESNFIGLYAGSGATNGNNSNFFGLYAGSGATNANNSNFIGKLAGVDATNALNSNFFGQEAGYQAISASYSNLFGYKVGKLYTGNDIGSNNIIIGTNISLANATANAINIGGVLFGKNAYSTTTGDPSITAVSNGSIGIGVVPASITARLHLAAGTATANTAPLKFTSGTNLTTPEDGAVEYDGTHLYVTIGSTRYQLDQQSGGGGTPGGSTTQLQYNNAGAFGGISGATTNGTNVTFGSGNLLVSDITASGSGGIALKNSGGTSIISLGGGGGVNASIAAPTNIGTDQTDYIQIAGGTGATTFTATGGSTNINISLVPKGTGVTLIPTVTGGTSSGGNLTLSTTTNATKGSILFGTSSYNESTNTLGIGTTASTTNRVTIADTTLAGSGSLAGSALDISQTWNTSGSPAALRVNVTNTASGSSSTLASFQVGGANRQRFDLFGNILFGTQSNIYIGPATGAGGGDATGLSLRYMGNQAGNSGYDHHFSNTGNRTFTSGTGGVLNVIGQNYQVTSGTGVFNHTRLAPLINQTGTASGITRGLLIEPTLTAAADFRAIEVTAGRSVFAGRVQFGKGADVAAANNLTLGAGGNVFVITGNTQINAITTAAWQAGSEITLIFTGTPTVKHNTAGGAGTAVMFLAGSVDLTAANNTVLKLVYDGTQWQEVSRKVA